MSAQMPAHALSQAEVLFALRHFAQVNSDEPFMWPGVERITVVTTLNEFESLRDSSGDLGRALNDFFRTAVSDGEWGTVLADSRRKTVGDLCEFLSSRATRAALERFDVLDCPCPAAAIFLTLKAALAAGGLNVRNLTPSTPIARYAWNYPNYCTLVAAAVRIAPARLPLSEFAVAGKLWVIGKLTGCGLCLVVAVGLLCGGRQFVLATVLIGIVAAALFMVAALASGFACGWNHLPGVHTFRDLCKVLAGEPTERPTSTKGLAT